VEAATTGELHFIYVAQRAWGSGIGRQLLAHATCLLRKDGYQREILWVFSKNRIYKLAASTRLLGGQSIALSGQILHGPPSNIPRWKYDMLSI
jgi:GNAT superfamily N-acetyltransferase